MMFQPAHLSGQFRRLACIVGALFIGTTARLHIQASGVVDLFSPEVIPGAPGLVTNAAGVFVKDTTGVGGVLTGGVYDSFNSRKPDPDGLSGSLLLGNTTLGFVPLFLATAETGLGSSVPPVELTTIRPVSDLFASPLAAGTVLQLRVNDINASDNVGRFEVTIAVVPEPTGICLWSIAGAILLAVVKKSRASHAAT